MSQGLCQHCKEGYILAGEPKGSFIDTAYFSPGSFAAESAQTNKAIILLTDAFGIPLKNSRILADYLAEKVGHDVWVPDYFGGQPILGVTDLDGVAADTPGQKMSIMQRLTYVWTIVKIIPGFIKNRPSVQDTRIHSFLEKLKAEKKYDKIGVVGYCMGGAATIRLASTNLVDAAVVAHPGLCNIDQIKAMKVPTAWVLAEEDMTFKPKLRHEAEAVFAERKDKDNFIDYEFVDYKGTVHGFAARPNLGISHVKEAFEKASDQTVQWFKKTL